MRYLTVTPDDWSSALHSGDRAQHAIRARLAQQMFERQYPGITATVTHTFRPYYLPLPMHPKATGIHVLASTDPGRLRRPQGLRLCGWIDTDALQWDLEVRQLRMGDGQQGTTPMRVLRADRLNRMEDLICLLDTRVVAKADRNAPNEPKPKPTTAAAKTRTPSSGGSGTGTA